MGQPPYFNLITRYHLEPKAVRSLISQNTHQGTLHSPLPPCVGDRGCERLLPWLLGPGRRLRVVAPKGFDKVYVGVPPDAKRSVPISSERKWTLRWSPEDECTIDSMTELESMLRHLKGEYADNKAMFAELSSPGAGSLAIGVGRSMSALNFIGAEPGLASHSSKGDLPSEEMIPFKYMTQDASIEAAHLIPWELAVDAIQQFFSEGKRPAIVDWLED